MLPVDVISPRARWHYINDRLKGNFSNVEFCENNQGYFWGELLCHRHMNIISQMFHTTPPYVHQDCIVVSIYFRSVTKSECNNIAM